MGRDHDSDYKHIAKYVTNLIVIFIHVYILIFSSVTSYSIYPIFLSFVSSVIFIIYLLVYYHFHVIVILSLLRSLSRVGKAYMKKEDLDKAIYYYDKAITEHRDPNILKERSDVGFFFFFFATEQKS